MGTAAATSSMGAPVTTAASSTDAPVILSDAERPAPHSMDHTVPQNRSVTTPAAEQRNTTAKDSPGKIEPSTGSTDRGHHGEYVKREEKVRFEPT